MSSHANSSRPHGDREEKPAPIGADPPHDHRRTLLLDVDGVLQHPAPGSAAAMEAAFDWRDGYAAFEADVFADETYRATMTGAGDVLEALQPVLDRHADGASAAGVHELWCTQVEVNEELVALLPRLDVAAIYLATNQDARRAAVVQATYGDLGWCSGIFVSCALGARKPQPEFFHAVLAALAVPAHQCFLVDDKEEFVEGAASLGIAGACYVDLAGLRADLSRAGLLRT